MVFTDQPCESESVCGGVGLARTGDCGRVRDGDEVDGPFGGFLEVGHLMTRERDDSRRKSLSKGRASHRRMRRIERRAGYGANLR